MKNVTINQKNSNRGFSLVELIIVIAIMAILVGVIAPQLIGYIYKAKRVKDVSMADVVREASEYAYMMNDIPLFDSDASREGLSLQHVNDGHYHTDIKNDGNMVYCAWNKSAEAAVNTTNPVHFLEYTVAECDRFPASSVNPDYIISFVFDPVTAKCIGVYLTDDPLGGGYDKYELYPDGSEYIAHGPNF